MVQILPPSSTPQVSSAPPKLEWRIYYGDGRTYSNLDGPPELAPALDVQAITQYSPESGKVQTQHGSDFYWYEYGQWDGQKDTLGMGFFDYLMRPGWRKVVFGRTTRRSSTFRNILRKATNDPDFVRS